MPSEYEAQTETQHGDGATLIARHPGTPGALPDLDVPHAEMECDSSSGASVHLFMTATELAQHIANCSACLAAMV